MWNAALLLIETHSNTGYYRLSENTHSHSNPLEVRTKDWKILPSILVTHKAWWCKGIEKFSLWLSAMQKSTTADWNTLVLIWWYIFGFFFFVMFLCTKVKMQHAHLQSPTFQSVLYQPKLKASLMKLVIPMGLPSVHFYKQHMPICTNRIIVRSASNTPTHTTHTMFHLGKHVLLSGRQFTAVCSNQNRFVA